MFCSSLAKQYDSNLGIPLYDYEDIHPMSFHYDSTGHVIAITYIIFTLLPKKLKKIYFFFYLVKM